MLGCKRGRWTTIHLWPSYPHAKAHVCALLHMHTHNLKTTKWSEVSFSLVCLRYTQKLKKKESHFVEWLAWSLPQLWGCTSKIELGLERIREISARLLTTRSYLCTSLAIWPHLSKPWFSCVMVVHETVLDINKQGFVSTTSTLGPNPSV